MRYCAIQEHDRRYPIRLMCRALAVSPAVLRVALTAGEPPGGVRPHLAFGHPGDPPGVP